MYDKGTPVAFAFAAKLLALGKRRVKRAVYFDFFVLIPLFVAKGLYAAGFLCDMDLPRRISFALRVAFDLESPAKYL
jgi:hypothetical protein